MVSIDQLSNSHQPGNEMSDSKEGGFGSLPCIHVLFLLARFIPSTDIIMLLTMNEGMI